ncbi:MAG: hypothetical protein ACTSWN_02660 [Promethearchaeota archaeon]
MQCIGPPSRASRQRHWSPINDVATVISSNSMLASTTAAPA